MKKNILIYISSICLSLFIIMFVGQTAFVSGESMYPTLNDEDFVVLEKITKEYDRFDIVIAKVDHMFVIKRVIGLPGETLQIIDNYIYINGEKIKDPIDVNMDDYGILNEELALGEDEYFIMGDNRNHSFDSRNEDFGPIKRKNITGRVFFSLKPLKSLT